MQTEFIVMTASAQVSGKARRFGRYRDVAVCEVEAGKRPKMISERARGMVRIITDSGPVSEGKTDQCAYARALREATAMARDLNLLAAHAAGTRQITTADVVACRNEELRRRMIEACGGIEAAMQGAREIQADHAGRLMELPTAGEPLRAVVVRCPSTGAVYWLRVPPSTKTAHEGVAWTFGLPASEYRPTTEA
jgi:hypothetical protein